MLSRLAQLVERKTLNLVVVGSSPTVGAFFVFATSVFSVVCLREAKKNFGHRCKKKDSTSGNRTRGVCVTGRNVTNYTNADKPPTRFELVTFRLLSECSAN